jgi:CubicO group peptidase (beta-lactamase class C family)
MRRLAFCAAASLLIALASGVGPAGAGSVAKGPFEPGSDWEVVAPGDVGMDSYTLNWSRVYAFQEGRNTQGVVVVRHDAIAAEWYAPGRGPDSWGASWSMAKSFTSALIGIAIEDGLIPSVDEPLATYYPHWAGTPRDAITLRHVLHQASGLHWNEEYDPDAGPIEESEIIQLVLFQPDELAYVSDLQYESEPGTVFNYSSGNTLLLSGVIEQATGMSVAEYAQQELFGPIGIDQVEWWQDAAGHTLTYCCLDMPSRDFARMGLLFLNDGMWGDEPVVPAQWVVDSTTPSPAFDGYGYQWWLEGNMNDRLPDDTYAAEGHDGQFIYVIPSLDLVVVRNGIYDKFDGPGVAEPNLYGKYPSDSRGDHLGTMLPEIGWDDAAFLLPIIESIQDV